MPRHPAPPPALTRRHRPDFCAPESRRFILVAAILASALGFIDTSVVAIAIPAMRESLGASLAAAQWFSNGYMLALAALTLVGGAAGDRFGIARVFGAGIALFVVASLLCALAPTPDFLIVGRAVQGLGAAAMVPGSLAIIARAYPSAERGRAIGIWAAASALTTAAGPVLGGLVLSLGGPEVWRGIFAVNLPLGGAALWLLLARVGQDAARPDRGIDAAGAALATLGLGLVAWALTEGGPGGGADGLALVLGLAALAAFLAQERMSPHPMMPLALFASPTFSAANLATFVLYFALSTIMFFLPMTVIAAWGVDEFAASAALAPLPLSIFLFSSRVGACADRTGPGPLIAAGAALVALAYAALALIAPSTTFWLGVVPAMVVMGIGMSLVVAPLSTAVMSAAGEEDAGTASAINNAVSRMAGLVAVAAMGSLAAGVYADAGGAASFGAASDARGHLAASNSAFTAIAWVASGLSLLSALVAALGIRAPVAAEAPALPDRLATRDDSDTAFNSRG